MDDPTQAAGGTPRDPGSGVQADRHVAAGALSPATAADEVVEGSAATPSEVLESPISGVSIQQGLLAWLGIVSLGGIGCVLLGHAEGAVFFAAAGAFALAQATDAAASLERYREFVREQLPERSAHGWIFRTVIRSLVPAGGALMYAALGVYAMNADPDHPQRFTAGWCAFAALVSLSTIYRPIADAAMRLFFGSTPGRTRRLTARLLVLALLLPVPGVMLGPSLMATVRSNGTPLADPASLVAQMLGELAIALAGVGWFVRRDTRAVLVRLGITGMRPGYFLVGAMGLLAIVGLNSGSDWVQHRFFPMLWAQDRDVTRYIAGGLTFTTAVLLGISAGVGEEVAIRGALQPRLGILLSAIVFATGHVQYTWFGMSTIALLGVLLGVVRGRSNTTTAILVHVTYDIYAALTANG